MNDVNAEREIMTAEAGTIAILNSSEINQQIATAHKFPRSVKKFLNEARELVTLTESVADECIYALPRDGKTIEGPSARFAEIMVHAWGNSRAGARVVDEGSEFVTAQGVFHDLEKNVAITYEVKRRITDKNGKRYKPDMIGVTANAACSIALRNAILKGVPKALWAQLYEDARRIVMGDAKTLANRRAEALTYLQKLGATEPMVLALLGVSGVEDITLDHLVTLRGIATAIKEGDTTVEQAFGPKPTMTKTVKRAPVDITPKQEPPPASAAVDTATGEILPQQPTSAAPLLDDLLLDVSQSMSADDLDFVRSKASHLGDADRAALSKAIAARFAAIQKEEKF